jgi:hypothetical protein
MPLSIWFWIFMAIWLVFSLIWGYRVPESRWALGGTALIFVLFVILGMAAFGGPVK